MLKCDVIPLNSDSESENDTKKAGAIRTKVRLIKIDSNDIY